MGTPQQPISTELAAIVEWMRQHVEPVIVSGETCTVTVQIGEAGIKAFLERKHIITRTRRAVPIRRCSE